MWLRIQASAAVLRHLKVAKMRGVLTCKFYRNFKKNLKVKAWKLWTQPETHLPTQCLHFCRTIAALETGHISLQNLLFRSLVA